MSSFPGALNWEQAGLTLMLPVVASALEEAFVEGTTIAPAFVSLDGVGVIVGAGVRVGVLAVEGLGVGNGVGVPVSVFIGWCVGAGVLVVGGVMFSPICVGVFDVLDGNKLPNIMTITKASTTNPALPHLPDDFHAREYQRTKATSPFHRATKKNFSRPKLVLMIDLKILMIYQMMCS